MPLKSTTRISVAENASTLSRPSRSRSTNVRTADAPNVRKRQIVGRVRRRHAARRTKRYIGKRPDQRFEHADSARLLCPKTSMAKNKSTDDGESERLVYTRVPNAPS